MANESALPLIVPKVWGREIWLVNEPEYCFKMLEVKKGASGSLHYHPVKKETFVIAEGKIRLEYGGKKATLKSGPMAVTIGPGIQHRITGLKTSVVFEVSTHHDDEDVVRIEESKL